MAERVRSGKIVVLPMASATPEEVGSDLVAEFKKNGAKSVVSVNLTWEQASLPEGGTILSDAGGVYFACGDQARITRVLCHRHHGHACPVAGNKIQPENTKNPGLAP